MVRPDQFSWNFGPPDQNFRRTKISVTEQWNTIIYNKINIIQYNSKLNKIVNYEKYNTINNNNDNTINNNNDNNNNKLIITYNKINIIQYNNSKLNKIIIS